MNMKFGIAAKFTLALTAVLAVVFLSQSVLLIKKGDSVARKNIIDSAGAFASLSTEEVVDNFNLYYASDFDKYKEVIKKLFRQNSNLVKIKMSRLDGEILFDSDEVVSGKYQSHDGKPRIVYENESEGISASSQSFRFTKDEGDEYLEITNPHIGGNGEHDYTVEYYFSFSSLETSLWQVMLNFVVLFILFCLLAAVFIFLLSVVFVVRPLKKITAAADSFNGGNFDAEVKIKAKDEIGALADSLNLMFRDLKKSRAELEWYAKNLEVKIKTRTNELEVKNAEQAKINEKLEHTNKLMVGRELRMIELKKEVEELKKNQKSVNKDKKKN